MTQTSETLMDHVLVNRQEMYATQGTLEVGLFDHYLIYTSRKKQKLDRPKINIYTRSYKTYNSTDYYLDTCQIDWSLVLNSQNTDEALDNFLALLMNVMDTHAPFKQIRCREKGAEWVTNELLGLIDVREYRQKEYNKNPKDQHFRLWHELFMDVKHVKKEFKLTKKYTK